MTEATCLRLCRSGVADTRRWSSVVLAVVIMLFESQAAGQTLEEAQRRYLEADFRGATEAFNAVFDLEDLEVSDAATAHLYLAALALMFDDEARATLHAEAALALDPFLEPPAGSPSRLAELIRDIHDRTNGRSAEIEIRHQGPLEPDSAVEVSARLDPAPSVLAATISLECTTEEGTTVRERGPPPEIQLSIFDATGALQCVAAALTSAGATLVLASLETVLETRTPVSFTQDRPEPQRPRSRRWLWAGVVTGVVAALAIVGIVLGVTLTDDDVILNETTIEGW